MAKPQLECVKLRDVLDFACRHAEEKKAGEPAPISRSRARAWQSNPHADPDDIALIVARIDGHCAGYLGLMPALAKIHEQTEKVYWFSTLYVPEDRRNTAIGGVLLMRAIALGYSLAATGSSQEARKTYEALQFVEHGSLDYYELDLTRRNLLGGPFRLARKLVKNGGRETPLLDRAVATSGKFSRDFIYPLLLNRFAPTRRSWSTTTSCELPERGFEASTEERPPIRFLRDAELVSWMLREHWVTTEPAEDTPDYHFKDLRDHFEYRVVEVSDPESGADLGWMVVWLTSRDQLRDLHVLDYSMDTEIARDLMARIAIEQARDFDAHRIFLPDICARAIQAAGGWGGRFKKHSRPSFCRPSPRARVLRESLPNLQLDYADGDIGFA